MYMREIGAYVYQIKKKFLCLILLPGDVCTDTNDADTNEVRQTKHD